MSWTCFKIVQEWGEIGGDIGCKIGHHRNWVMGICGVHDTILPFYVFEISYNKKKNRKGWKTRYQDKPNWEGDIRCGMLSMHRAPAAIWHKNTKKTLSRGRDRLKMAKNSFLILPVKDRANSPPLESSLALETRLTNRMQQKWHSRTSKAKS